MPVKGSSAAQLNYVIAARDAQFQRVATQVVKRLERLEKHGKATAKSTQGFVGALKNLPGAAVLATAASGAFSLSLGRLNQNLQESISRLDQLGKRARNIDVNVETLQLWSQAAKEAGVDANQFQRGLLNLNKVIGEAGEGVKTYTDIFDRMGVEIRKPSGALKSVEEILPEITENFANLEVAVQQQTVEELFSRAGKEMRAFLVDFKSQTSAVESGFRGVSAEAVALGEEFQNMRDRGLGNLTAAFDELLIRADAFFGVSQRITSLWDGLANTLQSYLQPSGATPIPVVITQDNPPPGMARRTGTPSVKPPVTDLEVEKDLEEQLRKRREAEDAAHIAYVDTLQRNQEAVDRFLKDRYDREQQLAKVLTDKKQRLADEEFQRDYDLSEQLQRQKEEAAKRERLEEQYRYAVARQNLRGVIGDFIRGADDLGSALTGVLNSLADSIIDKFAGKITDSLLSSAAGSFLGSIFGFQRGGAVQRGRAILVGEGGPEVFVPRESGHIIPNHVASAAPAGPVVTFNLHIQSTDGPGVRAAIREAEPRLTAVALSAVAVQQSRPGTVLGRQNRHGG